MADNPSSSDPVSVKTLTSSQEFMRDLNKNLVLLKDSIKGCHTKLDAMTTVVSQNSTELGRLQTEFSTQSQQFQARLAALETREPNVVNATLNDGFQEPTTPARNSSTTTPGVNNVLNRTLSPFELLNSYREDSSRYEIRPLVKPVKLPVFEGDSDKAATWLRSYEQAAALNYWTDTELIRGVGSCLKGEADNWFWYIYGPKTANTEQTWTKFKELFAETYMKDEDKFALHEKLITRTHRPDERIGAYFHDKLAMCMEYDSAMKETETINYVLRGLEPGIRLTIAALLDKDKTLANLARLIRINDQYVPVKAKKERVEEKKTHPTRSTPVTTKSSEPRNDVGNERPRREFNVTCYNCLDPGHTVRRCRKPINIERIKANQAQLMAKRRGQEPDTANVDIPDESVGPEDLEDQGRDWRLISGEINLIDTPALINQVNLETFVGNVTLPSLIVHVNEHTCRALIDTGARLSLMKDDFRLRAGLELKPWNFGALSMANQVLDYPYGYCETTIRVNRLIIPTRFIVMLRLGYDMLLGSDFCSRHNVQISYAKKSVSLVKPHPDVIRTPPQLRTLFILDDEVPGTSITSINAVDLTTFADVFAQNENDVGCIPDAFHSIDCGTHPPIQQKYYPVSQVEREVIGRLVDDMLSADIVVPSTSPWASPIVLVKKKGGKTRFCIDYRKLNAITMPDPFPIPRVEDALDILEGCVAFSTLDIAAMYWHIRMNPPDQCKTAFIVPQGLFECKVMPFGLKGAPATACRTMNRVLAGINYINCFIYFDDILIFGKDQAEHDNNLIVVLKRLGEYNVKLRKEKCSFNCSSIDYLGYSIDGSGISPSSANIESVEKFPYPTNCKDIRRFLGLCSYFRRFIPRFSQLAHPLSIMLKKNSEFKWGPQESDTFNQLKNIITQKPVLACFGTQGNIELHTDACNHGIGAVLYQEQPNENRVLKPVCFVSRTLNPAEINYGVTEKECLAIVWATQRLRTYLYGRQFVIVTDHCGLCWLNVAKNINQRLTRWSLKLQEFHFTVVYKSGRLHGDADCVSRYPLPHIETEIDDAHIFPGKGVDEKAMIMSVDIQPSIKTAQQTDPFCQRIINLLSSDTLTKRTRKRLVKKFTIQDGLLLFKGLEYFVPVIPRSMKQKILQSAHNEGHMGINKCIDKLRLRVYWPGMSHDVKEFVRSCKDCQLRKSYPTTSQGLMIPIKIPKSVFQDISLDLVEMPISMDDYRYVVCINDRLSKFAVTAAIKTSDSDEVINVLFNDWILRFGVPVSLLTDRGTNLLSEQFSDFLKIYGITHRPTTSYHPQSDGQTERFNAYLGTTLSIYAKKNPKEWNKYLNEVIFAYNVTPHLSTKFSPFFMAHGIEARLPWEGALNVQPGWTNVTTREEVLDKAREIAQLNIEQQQRKSKNYYDKSHKEVTFQKGDYILLKQPLLIKGKSKKFIDRFKGPYKIVRKLNAVNYEIVNLKGPLKIDIVHINRMRPFHRKVIEEEEDEIENLFDF